MKDLFIFEFKKIIKKRLNIILILGSLILTALLFTLPVLQYSVTDKDGNQLNGTSAIKLEKQFDKEVKGILTEERVKNDISKYQDLFKNPANVIVDGENKKLNNKILNSYVYPYISYLMFINGTYVEANMNNSSFSAINNLSIENGANFYKARAKKVSKILNATYEDWNYSDQEKNFWLEKNAKIETPYMYGYHGGWENLFNCIELLILPIITICICIAPVFAGEYQSGADSIILSSRYGKSKLIVSKILASCSFAFIVYTLNVFLDIGIILSSFGTDGWNLPLQIMNSTIPYPYTFLTATIICITALYLVLFGMVVVTLLLSSKLKTPFSVLISIILIIMLPIFFKVSLTNGIWNHILMLLPYTSCQSPFDIYYDTTSYFSYPFPGFTLDLVTMRIFVYALVFIICIPFAYNGFKKHQVR